jgi:HSP20 family molecular chaperone IbpA
MTSRDISHWMWSEALSMLDRAERLQRQFFTHATVAWEPPVDVLETADGLALQVALPGVSADSITIGLDPEGVSISALRAFPCRENTTQIHRIEIPYGRFERRVALPLADPYNPLELASRTLADGVLTLVFRRRQGA